MGIKKLSDQIINQIAAGEVVERPASVVKELVENAIDAGATYIDIFTSGGGKALIKIQDNGCGIRENELSLAVLRHCTSKMQDDIHEIKHLGFRGEALPSIGSVAKLRLASRHQNSTTAYEINVVAGAVSTIQPCAGKIGTTVEVRDLFYITPARLKFLKNDKAENAAISQIIKNMAIAHPHIHFSINGTDRQKLEYCTVKQNDIIQRISDIIDKSFAAHALEINYSAEDIKITGFSCTPQFDRGNNLSQYIYVNKRPIRDKLILGAIKAAYIDLIPKDRYGVCILFIEIPPRLVDVNVHPAKADVRFQNSKLIRSSIIQAIKETLQKSGVKTSTIISSAMMRSFTSAPNYIRDPSLNLNILPATNNSNFAPQTNYETYPLGAARAQFHKNYIISQTKDGIIIIDQHAAHERIVYEKLKEALYKNDIKTQMLLIPSIISLDENRLQILINRTELLAKFGLIYEPFGTDAILVRGIAAILGETNIENLLNDIADKLLENENINLLESKINYIAATMACHGSIRSGRILQVFEMNELLRKMEQTPGSSTCNHGRPTYIELKLKDIERLFNRR